MPKLRFQHVFAGLMLLAFASAFLLPQRFGTRAQPQLQGLFAPVGEPVHHLAAWAQQRFFRDKPIDDRPADTLAAENHGLRVEVALLEKRLSIAQEDEAEQHNLGPLGKLTVRFPVIGSDAGTRESLAVRGTTFEGLREGLVALCPQCAVGIIDRAGAAGVQVLLTTDARFRVRAAFGSFRREGNGVKFVVIPVPVVVLEGIGHGTMVSRSLTKAAVDASGLAVGDWAVAADPEWPEVVQGLHIGQVTRIGTRRDAPLYAEITIKPPVDLLRLREVRVVTKEP